MKLAFCVIVEGDERLDGLKKLFESVEGVFDTHHITVNRKPHDKTKKWCEEKGYDFSYRPWNDDFSDQRNFNFSRAPEDTNYICWADSDDVIINAKEIRTVAKIAIQNEYDTVFFDYWYGNEFDGEPSLETFKKVELTQTRERLIVPKKIEWKKRIHETPVPIDGENFKYTRVKYTEENPIAWLHLGADRDIPPEILKARMDRNQRLLEMELEDERKTGEADPRTILYLMKIYAESDDGEILNKCIALGKEYLNKSGWDQERAVCFQLMSKCIGKLGEHAEARDFLHNAIKEFPHDPLLYLQLARAYFNLKNYNAMEHWMKIGMGLDLDDKNTTFNNILELKILSSELLLEWNLHGKKDIRQAYKAAKMLNKVLPNKTNQENEDFLKDQSELDEASEHAHKFLNFLRDKKREDLIPGIIENIPYAMRRLPFFNKYYNRYKEPKIWADNEICYFASFGKESFEKWDGASLDKGLGGSETAVIRLSEQWAKQGYKVTVYCDPVNAGEYNGVDYQPYYKFNQRDSFNILIQWRHNHLIDKVKAKKIFIDLHDVFFETTHINKLDHIDGFFVKSKYHRELAPSIPDFKFNVVGNGI